MAVVANRVEAREGAVGLELIVSIFELLEDLISNEILRACVKLLRNTLHVVSLDELSPIWLSRNSIN